MVAIIWEDPDDSVNDEDEFVARCLVAANDLALHFVGCPEEQMRATLARTREELTRRFAVAFGAKDAAEVVDRFIATVVERRAEIERDGCRGCEGVSLQ